MSGSPSHEVQWSIAGTLTVEPARERLDLVAPPVAELLRQHPGAEHVGVAAIDPDLAGTAECCAAYSLPISASANCVVILGKRGADSQYAVAVVLGTTKADVNGVIRRKLSARRASFAPMDDATSMTGMAYGGITPVGLPSEWSIFIDKAVADSPELIVGGGVRSSKLLVSGDFLASLPNAEVVDGLALANLSQ